MSEHTSPPKPTIPDEAMNTALQAERQAVDGIEACTRQAAKLIEDAQQQARRIAERTNRRISDLHTRCARATEAHIDSMLKEDANAAEAGIQLQMKTKFLKAAVDSIAARLTGLDERSN